MAQLEFFAARDDVRLVLDFLFSHTDVRVLELASAAGREVHEFRSSDEVITAYDRSNKPRGEGTRLLLQLWSPAVSANLLIERIYFDLPPSGERTFGESPKAWGLIQLYLGGVSGSAITKTHFGHNSQARARDWDHQQGVDWDALERLSRKIRYHIGRRLAVTRVPGRPILPHALRLAREGYALKEFAQSQCSYDPPLP